MKVVHRGGLRCLCSYSSPPRCRGGKLDVVRREGQRSDFGEGAHIRVYLRKGADDRDGHLEAARPHLFAYGPLRALGVARDAADLRGPCEIPPGNILLAGLGQSTRFPQAYPRGAPTGHPTPESLRSVQRPNLVQGRRWPASGSKRSAASEGFYE